MRVATTEVFLYLFYIVSFNTLIWLIFNIIYSYIIKGLTYSLKQIKNLYLLILSKVTNTEDDLSQKTTKLLNELGVNINNESYEAEDIFFNSVHSVSKLFNDYIIKAIHNLFQMQERKEIQQSFITLKAIIIILLYNNSNHKNK